MKVPSGVGEGFKRCSPINPTLSLTADNGQNKKKELKLCLYGIEMNNWTYADKMRMRGL